MKALLTQALSHYPLASLPRHSRIHPLRTFSIPSGPCYVKREDELGFGISGTKVRKYLSLLPAILKDKPEEAILIGSAYSNHILSFSQLLRENGIEPVLFLLGDEACKMQGNLLYSALIAKTIHWVPRGKWDDIDQIAESFAKERKKAIVVPKGGNCAASLPGAMTLALDIIRNEEESGIAFDHLFIDSGTGLTTCALLLAFAYLKKKTFVHVLLVAGDAEEFQHTLALRKKDFEDIVGEAVPSPVHFKLYIPSIAPAFGAVNAAIFKTIADIAQNEGFLTDPVFTAKLFYEGKKILKEQVLTGNVLFIHSGGGLGLTGFQDQMSKLTNWTKVGAPLLDDDPF
jgi:1-aminocyclopropane-1-carboxylate deaminase